MRFSGDRRGRAAWRVARGLMLVCALVLIGRGRMRGQEQPGNPPEPAGQAAGKELAGCAGRNKEGECDSGSASGG